MNHKESASTDSSSPIPYDLQVASPNTPQEYFASPSITSRRLARHSALSVSLPQGFKSSPNDFPLFSSHPPPNAHHLFLDCLLGPDYFNTTVELCPAAVIEYQDLRQLDGDPVDLFHCVRSERACILIILWARRLTLSREERLIRSEREAYDRRLGQDGLLSKIINLLHPTPLTHLGDAIVFAMTLRAS